MAARRGGCNVPNDKVTMCPLEISHHGKVIICEGCGMWERTVHEFEDMMAQRQWRLEFCTNGCYRGCPYYNATMDFKYQGESEEDDNA